MPRGGTLPDVAAIAALLAAVVACERAERTGETSGETASEMAPPDTVAPSVPTMAVTIDDLPWVGAVPPEGSKGDALASLIDALSERDVAAIGFVNCDRVQPGAPLLRMWLDAGLALGNHTAAHLDLNDAPVEQWLGDLRSCHDMLRDLTGRRRVWFRYPYLHQGPTPDRQRAALAALRELESPIAHVTIDNSDWILAVAYGNAVRAGDAARAAAIGAAFVDHIVRAVRHYQQVAEDKIGRDVPHVLLLHANLLVADHVGRLLDRLSEEHGFRFVSLDAAQRDAIYDLEDGYTGPGGLSWLYRLTPPTPEMGAWDDAEAQRLRAQWRE